MNHTKIELYKLKNEKLKMKNLIVFPMLVVFLPAILGKSLPGKNLKDQSIGVEVARSAKKLVPIERKKMLKTPIEEALIKI